MRLLAGFFVCGLAAMLSAETHPRPDRGSTGDLVDAAASYVAAYERELTSVLADETYTQRILTQVPAERNPRKSRTLRSEMFFMFAPLERGWMAIRDVAAVDGRPVSDRPDLRAALRTLPSAQVATTFKTYNSRFNLGRVVRNFNEPTLSLLVLDQQHRGRFSFERRRVERRSDGVLVTIAFLERTAPTLISDLRLQPVYSRGQFVVEEDTGRVRQAAFHVTIGAAQMDFTTTYTPDSRLGMWVPATFTEHYEDGVEVGDAKSRMLDAPARYEKIECEAKYTNFRRFEATVRIK